MKQVILNLYPETVTMSMIKGKLRNEIKLNEMNETIYNTEVLKSNLCNYNDVYILIIGHNVIQVAFKNCASLNKCITKIDGITIDDAEDLDLVMPIYNL